MTRTQNEIIEPLSSTFGCGDEFIGGGKNSDLYQGGRFQRAKGWEFIVRSV